MKTLIAIMSLLLVLCLARAEPSATAAKKAKTPDALKAEIEALKQMERYLSQMLLEWKKRMRKTPAGGRAFLLSSMQEMSGPAMPFKNSLRRKK